MTPYGLKLGRTGGDPLSTAWGVHLGGVWYEVFVCLCRKNRALFSLRLAAYRKMSVAESTGDVTDDFT